MVENDNLTDRLEIGKSGYKNIDIIRPSLALSDGLSLYNITKVELNNIKKIENRQ